MLHRWCFADPAVFAAIRERVERTCAGIDPKDYASEYMAICHAAARDVRYRRDPLPVELVKSPDAILREIATRGFAQEDCESVALFIEVQCAALGGQTRFYTMSFEHGPRPKSWAKHPTWPWPPHTHAGVQAFDPNSGAWMTLDPVAGPRTGVMLGQASAVRFFNVPGQ